MLRFRLGSISVVVQPAHFLFALALGLSYSADRPRGVSAAEVVGVWVVLVFVSVLFHELGHALAFRAFGYASTVQLVFLGGVTTPSDRPAPHLGEGRGHHARGARVRSLAGPPLHRAAPQGHQPPRRVHALHRRGDEPRLGGVQPAPGPAHGRRPGQPGHPWPGVRALGGARRARARDAGLRGDRLPPLPYRIRGPGHPRLPPPVRGPELPGSDGLVANRAGGARPAAAHRGRDAVPRRRAGPGAVTRLRPARRRARGWHPLAHPPPARMDRGEGGRGTARAGRVQPGAGAAHRAAGAGRRVQPDRG